jgi:hypothetical protein
LSWRSICNLVAGGGRAEGRHRHRRQPRRVSGSRFATAVSFSLFLFHVFPFQTRLNKRAHHALISHCPSPPTTATGIATPSRTTATKRCVSLIFCGCRLRWRHTGYDLAPRALTSVSAHNYPSPAYDDASTCVHDEHEPTEPSRFIPRWRLAVCCAPPARALDMIAHIRREDVLLPDVVNTTLGASYRHLFHCSVHCFQFERTSHYYIACRFPLY